MEVTTRSKVQTLWRQYEGGSGFIEAVQEALPDARDLGELLWMMDRDQLILAQPAEAWLKLLVQAPRGAFTPDDVARLLERRTQADPLWSTDLEAIFKKLGRGASTVLGPRDGAMRPLVSFFCFRQALPGVELDSEALMVVGQHVWSGELRPYLDGWRSRMGDALVAKTLIESGTHIAALPLARDLTAFCLPFANDQERVELVCRLGPQDLDLVREGLSANPNTALELFRGKRVTASERVFGKRPIDALMGPMGFIGPLGAASMAFGAVLYWAFGHISLVAFTVAVISTFIGLRIAFMRPTPARYPACWVSDQSQDAVGAAIAAWVIRHLSVRGEAAPKDWLALSQTPVPKPVSLVAPDSVDLSFLPDDLSTLEPTQGLHQWLDSCFAALALGDDAGALDWASGQAVSRAASNSLYALLSEESLSVHRPAMMGLVSHLSSKSASSLRASLVGERAWCWADAVIGRHKNWQEAAQQLPDGEFFQMLARVPGAPSSALLAYGLWYGGKRARGIALEELGGRLNELAEGLEDVVFDASDLDASMQSKLAEALMIETAVAQRRWLPSRWRRVFLGRVLRDSTQRVLWAIFDGYGRCKIVFRVDESLELLGLDEEPLNIPAHHTIGIARQEDVADDTWVQWMELFADHELALLTGPTGVVDQEWQMPALQESDLERILAGEGWFLDRHPEHVNLMRPVVMADATAVYEFEWQGDQLQPIADGVIAGVHVEYPSFAVPFDDVDVIARLQTLAEHELRSSIERA